LSAIVVAFAFTTAASNGACFFAIAPSGFIASPTISIAAEKASPAEPRPPPPNSRVTKGLEKPPAVPVWKLGIMCSTRARMPAALLATFWAIALPSAS
jgi:hypothetical protein